MKYYFESDLDRSCYKKIKGVKETRWQGSNYSYSRYFYKVTKNGKEVFSGNRKKVADYLGIKERTIDTRVSRTRQGHKRKDGVEVIACEM